MYSDSCCCPLIGLRLHCCRVVLAIVRARGIMCAARMLKWVCIDYCRCVWQLIVVYAGIRCEWGGNRTIGGVRRRANHVVVVVARFGEQHDTTQVFVSWLWFVHSLRFLCAGRNAPILNTSLNRSCKATLCWWVSGVVLGGKRFDLNCVLLDRGWLQTSFRTSKHHIDVFVCVCMCGMIVNGAGV